MLYLQYIEDNNRGAVNPKSSSSSDWFTFLTGIVFAMSVNTGVVRDYHVFSKECCKGMLMKCQCQSQRVWRAANWASCLLWVMLISLKVKKLYAHPCNYFSIWYTVMKKNGVNCISGQERASGSCPVWVNTSLLVSGYKLVQIKFHAVCSVCSYLG